MKGSLSPGLGRGQIQPSSTVHAEKYTPVCFRRGGAMCPVSPPPLSLSPPLIHRQVCPSPWKTTRIQLWTHWLGTGMLTQ